MNGVEDLSDILSEKDELRKYKKNLINDYLYGIVLCDSRNRYEYSYEYLFTGRSSEFAMI